MGALWGRIDVSRSDDRLKELICAYRDRFAANWGGTKCQPIRDQMTGEEKVCLPVVLDGTRYLVDIIEQERQQELA